MDITPDVRANNLPDVPMTETDFYQWIIHTGYKPFRGLSVLYYMEDRYRYRIGQDVVSPALRGSLATIHDYYTQTVMHPIWGAAHSD